MYHDDILVGRTILTGYRTTSTSTSMRTPAAGGRLQLLVVLACNLTYSNFKIAVIFSSVKSN